MKEYIYQDTRFMRSIVSQVKGGVIVQRQTSNDDSETYGQEEEQIGSQISGEVGVNLIIGAKGQYAKPYTSSSNHQEVTEATTFTETLEAADSAYSEFEEIIVSLDGFEKSSDFFKIIDIENIINITSNDDVNALMMREVKLKAREKVEKEVENLNREQKRRSKNEIDKKIKEAEDTATNPISEGIRLLKIAEMILPSNLLLINKEYSIVLPLVRENLSLKSKQTNMFYKGIETTVLYKNVGPLFREVTENVNSIDMFDEMFSEMVKEFYKVLNIKENAKLCLPIAWYQDYGD